MQQNSSSTTTESKLCDNSVVLPEQNVGNIGLNDLMASVAIVLEKALDDKMKNLTTKEDMEFIKNQFHNITSQVDALKLENQYLKEEFLKLKTEREFEIQKLYQIEDQLKQRNIIIRGLTDKVSGINEEVENFLKNKLKMADPILLKSTRKVSAYEGKMTVIAEMDSSYAVEKVLRRGKMLAKTRIYIERDLNTEKQRQKKVMMQLKKDLLSMDRTHRVQVLNERLRIANKLFIWDKNSNLRCGSQDGKIVLETLYQNYALNIDLDFNNIWSKINNK